MPKHTKYDISSPVSDKRQIATSIGYFSILMSLLIGGIHIGLDGQRLIKHQQAEEEQQQPCIILAY